MPVQFNPDHLTLVPVMVKSVSTALGGSIRVVDDEDAEDFDPKGIKIDMPFHLARRFRGIAGGSKFIVPNKAEIIMYGDQPICFERFPYAMYVTESVRATLEEDLAKWVSWSQRLMREVVVPYVNETSNQFMWCIDGYYIYALPKNKDDWFRTSKSLTSNGNYRALRVKAFKVADFSVGKITKIESAKSFLVDKDCLVYRAPTGEVFITPPIWNYLGAVGSRKLASGDDEAAGGSNEVGVDNTLFDHVDNDLSVNISFALDVAGRVAKRFGFEAVEPLQLPEMMVAYTTVNLKKLPQSVKQTGYCGIQFTHTLAWLFGLFRDTDNFSDMLEFRAILKYLTTKGLQHSNIIRPESVFTEHFLKSGEKVKMYDEIDIMAVKMQDQRTDLASSVK